MIEGGVNEEECLAVAYSVAESPLVKTALFAGDPNWGRFCMAIGKAPVDQIDVNLVDGCHCQSDCIWNIMHLSG